MYTGGMTTHAKRFDKKSWKNNEEPQQASHDNTNNNNQMVASFTAVHTHISGLQDLVHSLKTLHGHRLLALALQKLAIIAHIVL